MKNITDKPKQVKTTTVPKQYVEKSSDIDLSVLQGWDQFATEISRRKHWEFFVIDQFIRGNHDISVDQDSNTIRIGRNKNETLFPINKTFAVFRAVRSFVTRHQPIVKVVPSSSSSNAKEYSRRTTRLLERDNELNNHLKLNKEWAYYGVKYGVGYRQVGYDKQKHLSVRWTIDPFDLRIGSRSGQFEDAPFIAKDIVRTIAYWKNKFPDIDIKADNKVSKSEYKQLSFDIASKDANQSPQRDEEQTAIATEFWYRVYKPNSLGGYINKCLYFESSNIIVSKEETPYSEYPFVPYYSEIVPNEIYPDGHIKQIIPVQRLMNLLNTQLIEYNHITNRGRYQFPKGAGFEVISAEEGQLIRYNPGQRVETVPVPAINPLLQWQLQYADESIQFIGAANDASLGLSPERVSSGRAIEALQMGDSNNVAELRSNFEEALALEASLILKMYSLFESDGVELSIEAKDNPERFAIIGETYKPSSKFYAEDQTALDWVSILPENRVKVSVTSKLGETSEARLNLLFKLLEAGMPIKYIFDYLEFPNTSDILERIAEENVAEIMKQQAATPQMPQEQMGPELP